MRYCINLTPLYSYRKSRLPNFKFNFKSKHEHCRRVVKINWNSLLTKTLWITAPTTRHFYLRWSDIIPNECRMQPRAVSDRIVTGMATDPASCNSWSIDRILVARTRIPMGAFGRRKNSIIVLTRSKRNPDTVQILKKKN